jgi:hypothetical protein
MSRSTIEPETLTAIGSVVTDVRSLVEDYAKAEVISVTEPNTGMSVPAVIAHGGIVSVPTSAFDAFRSYPRFRHGTAQMLSLDSLIHHINRFKDDGSAVFADDDRARPSITAVLDYHREGGAAEPLSGNVGQRFGKHRSAFNFPLSDEWIAWNEKNAEAMTMVDFAEFLENRIIDVLFIIPGEDSLPEDVQRLVDTLGGDNTVATPNKLMELARGLQINENAVVQEAVNLASGEGIVRFQSEHTDAHGQPVKVPSLFLIAIPVFRNGPFYRVAARLRYRKQGGRLTFWYELWRTDRTFDHAFKEAVERVAVETALPVFTGKPEA